MSEKGGVGGEAQGRRGEINQGSHRHRCTGRGHRQQCAEGLGGGCQVQRVLSNAPKEAPVMLSTIIFKKIIK